MEKVILIFIWFVFSSPFFGVLITNFIAKKLPFEFGADESGFPESKGVLYWATLVWSTFSIGMIQFVIFVFILNFISSQ